MTQQLLLGTTLAFEGNPLITAWEDCAKIDTHGAVLIDSGQIAAVGDRTQLRAAHPQADIVNYGDDLITAGFVDAHMHYPQTAMIASWGKQLIDWLNTYTFPEEARFADPAYAAEIAWRTCDLALSHGDHDAHQFLHDPPRQR